MATLRNKRKLAAVTRETQEEHPRNSQSPNTSVPRINEEYITQVSEEIESRVTKNLSQKFSRTESRILGALSKLDEFLLNQQIRTHSETVPGTFRNTNMENQGTNEYDSQSDPHPEVGPSVCQPRHSIASDTGRTHDTMTGVVEQTTKGPHTKLTFSCKKKKRLIFVAILDSCKFELRHFKVSSVNWKTKSILGLVGRLVKQLVYQ